MNNILIWGAGPTGKKIYNKIKELYHVKGFVDNNVSMHASDYDGVKIVAPKDCYKMIHDGIVEKIVLGTSPNNYDDILWQIAKEVNDFNELYYVKEIGSSNELIKYTDDQLGYIEFDVTRKCNLNCKGCLRYSNIAHDETAYQLEEFERDLKQLRKIFSNIAFIKILGGEPLLCKNLHDFLKVVFVYFPNTQVDILSNGILVPSMDRKLINEIKAHPVRVSISIYKGTEKYKNVVSSFCDNEGIEFNVYVNKEKFLKQLNTKGDSDGNVIVKECMSKKCTVIKDGIINRCCQPVYTYELNKKFGTTFPENIGIDIYEKGITYEKIKEFIRNNTLFCRYCTIPEEYVWSNGKKDIRLSDWVVK